MAIRQMNGLKEDPSGGLSAEGQVAYDGDGVFRKHKKVLSPEGPNSAENFQKAGGFLTDDPTDTMYNP